MTGSPSCERCRFCAISERQYAALECRRQSPIIVIHKSSCATWRAAGWPDVHAKHWCGEFKPDADGAGHGTASTTDASPTSGRAPK